MAGLHPTGTVFAILIGGFLVWLVCRPLGWQKAGNVILLVAVIAAAWKAGVPHYLKTYLHNYH